MTTISQPAPKYDLADYKSLGDQELTARIQAVRQQYGQQLLILGHHYQQDQVIALSDLRGDSYQLSKMAASNSQCRSIVFCGVHFMAETASILSPQKTVLLPRLDAGCPMADMIDEEALQAKLATLPDMPVVTYVNSTADVKALSTICCTSANVIKVANSLDAEEMLMTPDRSAQRRLEEGLRQAAVRGLLSRRRLAESRRRIADLRHWLRGFDWPV